MGRQIIGLDSSIFIYVWNADPVFLKAAKGVLAGIQGGRAEGIFSQIGLIELLTGPKKLGNYREASRYKEIILNFPNLHLGLLNEAIVDLASDLRAGYGLATPDAIHIATAINFGASKFITNDRALKRVKEIKIELLR